MNTIRPLLAAHAGQEAWIFGKGPSLDHFDMRTAGPLRICINEAVLVVPEPAYCFVHDENPIARVAESWPAACQAIVPVSKAVYALKRGIPGEKIYTYYKRRGKQRVLRWQPSEIARQSSLFAQRGTVHPALHFCRLIGATSVHLVGFDGTTEYARSLRVSGKSYHAGKIRKIMLEELHALGLPHEFHGELAAAA